MATRAKIVANTCLHEFEMWEPVTVEKSIDGIFLLISETRGYMCWVSGRNFELVEV